MPQMSPLNWLILFIYMLMILMVVNVILSNMFMIFKNLNSKKIFLKKSSYKWMW